MREGDGIQSCRYDDRAAETAGAIAEQHINIGITAVRYGQIEFAVAVEICGRQKHRRCSYRWRPETLYSRLKRPVAVAEKNGNVFTSEVGDRHIRLTVAIEIADGDGPGRASGRKIQCFGEANRLRGG